MIKEVGSLVLAAGLALSGCKDSKTQPPQERCEHKWSAFGVKGSIKENLIDEPVKDFCKEIEEKRSKDHCLRLREDLHTTFMSLCLTNETRFPHSCKKVGRKLVCKPAELMIEKSGK